MKKYLHDRNTKYYIENILRQFLNLQIISIAEYIVVKHIAYFGSFWNQNHSLLVGHIRFHSFSSVVPLVLIRCHSLPLVVPLVVTRCHSLYHSLPFVIIRCHSLYHSLSLYVPLVCLFIIDRLLDQIVLLFHSYSLNILSEFKLFDSISWNLIWSGGLQKIPTVIGFAFGIRSSIKIFSISLEIQFLVLQQVL